MSPFLLICFGGDYKVEILNFAKKSSKNKVISGEKGYQDMTEVLENLNVETKNKFTKEIDIEIRDSIINLMRQNILIEIWDYNRFKFNNYLGYHLLNIMRIINGNVYQSFMVEKKTGKIKKMVAGIEMKIIIQEIWDFVLTMEDWGALNFNNIFKKKDAKGMRPGVKVQLGQGKGKFRQIIKTKKNAKNVQ
jgi:hypothetical protein